MQIARSIEGAPGWSFKNIDAAAAELAESNGLKYVIRAIRRASNLSVVIVFGERR